MYPPCTNDTKLFSEGRGCSNEGFIEKERRRAKVSWTSEHRAFVYMIISLNGKCIWTEYWSKVAFCLKLEET